MDERDICRRLRHKFSANGWALLIYYGIMTVCVMAAAFLGTFLEMMEAGDGDMVSAAVAASESGLGYIIAIALGFLLLLLWKKNFCFRHIWKSEQPMRPSAFFSLFALFFGVQALVQIMTGIMESIFNMFGGSMMESMEQVSGASNSVSMFLYVSILAPLSEEILFRGVILRNLQPFGKKFAILASAFLFGVFHGNFIQTPYAFLVGLVLGYVTVEYSMWWAVLLHLLNNLVLADMMSRLSAIMPAGFGNLLTLLFIWGCGIASVVILAYHRWDIAVYVRTKRMHPWCLKSFFTSPGVLTFTGFMAASILLSFLMQLI